MDPDDGLEEDGPILPWLPPDDRLWRHPSELATTSGPTPAVQPDVATAATAATAAPSERQTGTSVGRPTPDLTAARAGTATLLTSREVDHRLWAVALLAGVVGALLASGAGAMVGEYRHSTTVVRPIEQVVQTGPYVTVGTDPRVDNIVDIAARIRPDIVALQVSTNGANASGSGVIFTGDGYVLTNNHIVDGAQSVVAIMSDGSRIKCHLVGSDRDTDIAVVQLQNTRPKSVAVLGSSTQLRVGQLAIAVGSPLGPAGGPSVTKGIVSAVGSQISPGSGPTLVDMIQTDAAIESGSSGGALVDGNGMVIGITTAIALDDQSRRTLGFATPIEVARDVANQILSTGKVTHPWLGIEGSDVDVASAKSLNITGGAVVQGLDSHSPAAVSGIAPTDVVTAFGNQVIDSMSTLETSIRMHRPGDRVTITYLHGGEIRTADVTLSERPASDYP